MGLLKQSLAGLPERIAEINADASVDDDLRASYAEDLAWLRRQADRFCLRWPDGCELVRAEGEWLRAHAGAARALASSLPDELDVERAGLESLAGDMDQEAALLKAERDA